MNSVSHIAIIMDGNGRWAKLRNKPRKYGHFKGSENIHQIVDFCLNAKIPYLTIFAFGLDNWNRPKSETSYLFNLFEDFFNKYLDTLIKKKIKIRFIGEIKKLSQNIKKKIKNVENLTEKKKNLLLSIALNYSSRDEILNVANEIIKKKIKKKITEKIFEKYLYTYKTPDPDILIRTGGHLRLSNFLLWQNSYTEIFFIKKYWPDFNAKDLNKIIINFKKIKRNFGSI